MKRKATKRKKKVAKNRRGPPLRGLIIQELGSRTLTVPELAQRLKKQKVVVYQVVSRMLQDGVLAKRGKVKGRRGRTQRFGLAPKWKPEKEMASLGARDLGDVTTNSLLNAFREVTGAEVSIVPGTGGRAGKGLYLQVRVK